MKKIILTIFFLYIVNAFSIDNKKIIELNLIGEKLFQNKQFEDALKYFNDALTLNNTNIRAIANKSVTLLKLNKNTEAINCLFKQFILVDNKSPSYNAMCYNFAKGYEQMNQYYAALYWYNLGEKNQNIMAILEKYIFNDLNN